MIILFLAPPLPRCSFFKLILAKRFEMCRIFLFIQICSFFPLLPLLRLADNGRHNFCMCI